MIAHILREPILLGAYHSPLNRLGLANRLLHLAREPSCNSEPTPGSRQMTIGSSRSRQVSMPNTRTAVERSEGSR